MVLLDAVKEQPKVILRRIPHLQALMLFIWDLQEAAKHKLANTKKKASPILSFLFSRLRRPCENFARAGAVSSSRIQSPDLRKQSYRLKQVCHTHQWIVAPYPTIPGTVDS